MKSLFCNVVVCLLISSSSLCFGARKSPLIINHNNIDIKKVPKKYVEAAKKKFKMAYGHTSHGSQIVSGMQALAKKNSLYKYSTSSSSDTAFLWDRIPSGDLGNPNQTEWAEKTRKLLKSKGKSRNIIMWSWCGQLSRSSTDVNKYLSQMSKLEKEFPKVTFVYMTGHLDGRGTRGHLHRNNEKIRKFCKKYNKVLFDFADIESYDPDGKTDYSKLRARDNCTYRKGRQNYNWATDWIKKNPRHSFALPSRAAHTHPLNAAMKGQAFWWMMARLAGWNPVKKRKTITTKTTVRFVL